MKKSVKTNKKEKTVSITVTIPERRLATDPVTQIRTRDVVKMLKEEGVSFDDKCIEECTVTNEKKTSAHSGTWVFPLIIKEEKSKPPKKTTPPKPKHRNSTKTVKSAAEHSSEMPVFTEKTTFGSKVLDKTAIK